MAVLKFDIATLLHERSVTFYDPIVIHEVTNTVAIASYILAGICGSVQLFLLGATVVNRHENVMKLSQSSFLILLQCASFVAIVGSVFYRPTSSWSCYLAGPLTLIPLQLMFAIIFGRLRRIYRIMEPLMNFNTGNDKNVMKSGLKKWKTVMMLGKASSSNKSSHASSGISNTSERASDPTSDESGNTGRFLSRLRSVKTPKTLAPATKLIRQVTYYAIDLMYLIGELMGSNLWCVRIIY